MTFKPAVLAAALLTPIFAAQALADGAITSFCPEGMPRETASINVQFTITKPGMSEAEAHRLYRSDVISLTRKTWKKTMQGLHFDNIMYRDDVYATEPHRYKLYSAEKEKAFWEQLQANLKKTFDAFKDKTGADAQVRSTLSIITPGCLMGG
ncbi:MAG TPA: hypothetical protein PLO23_00745 [Alphaproteobacteria bacterium]|nr:hypothetical protein [Alphaproteobacteria bacterium]